MRQGEVSKGCRFVRPFKVQRGSPRSETTRPPAVCVCIFSTGSQGETKGSSVERRREEKQRSAAADTRSETRHEGRVDGPLIGHLHRQISSAAVWRTRSLFAQQSNNRFPSGFEPPPSQVYEGKHGPSAVRKFGDARNRWLQPVDFQLACRLLPFRSYFHRTESSFDDFSPRGEEKPGKKRREFCAKKFSRSLFFPFLPPLHPLLSLSSPSSQNFCPRLFIGSPYKLKSNVFLSFFDSTPFTENRTFFPPPWLPPRTKKQGEEEEEVGGSGRVEF